MTARTVGDALAQGEVHVIGVEVRATDPRTNQVEEIGMFPLDAVLKPNPVPPWGGAFPSTFMHDDAYQYSVTIHTSHGDVNMNASQLVRWVQP